MGDEQHRHAEPLLRVLEQFQDLRLHRHVERRGRLVGNQQVGLIRQGHRDHHALALAARQLVRIARQPPLRIGDADMIEQLDDARARRLPRKPLMQQQYLADLLFDRVQRIERGHRLLEDDGDVVAADVADGGLRHGQHLAALEYDRAGGVMRRRIGQQLHHRQRGDRLAGTGLADQRHRRALAEGEREIANREQCFGRAHRKVFRGSKASRTASPMKISSDSITAMLKKPVNPSHGAFTLALACESISPSEGEPGGRPKPRKSSAVSVITEDDKMNGRNVMVATMAFGSRWRKMMTAFETPSARAAMMYSKLRPRRNSARTKPTSETHENNSRMPSSTKKPGTSTDEMISSR